MLKMPLPTLVPQTLALGFPVLVTAGWFVAIVVFGHFARAPAERARFA